MGKHKTCCIFGFGNLQAQENDNLKNLLQKLISEGVDSFFFYGKGNFINLCYKIISKLKSELLLNITRIYIPGVFENLSETQQLNLNWQYEDIYFLPKMVFNPKKSIKLQINNLLSLCDTFIFYCDNDYENYLKSKYITNFTTLLGMVEVNLTTHEKTFIEQLKTSLQKEKVCYFF